MTKPIEFVCWTDKRLKEITVLRLLRAGGYPAWDVSFCEGTLHDGSRVYVNLPFNSLPAWGMKAEIIKWAQAGGVYAKGLGILDEYRWSKLFV